MHLFRSDDSDGEDEGSEEEKDKEREGDREDGEDASGGEEKMRKGVVGRVKRQGSTRRQSRVEVRSESILYHHWPNILVFCLVFFVKLDRNVPRSEYLNMRVSLARNPFTESRS